MLIKDENTELIVMMCETMVFLKYFLVLTSMAIWTASIHDKTLVVIYTLLLKI